MIATPSKALAIGVVLVAGVAGKIGPEMDVTVHLVEKLNTYVYENQGVGKMEPTGCKHLNMSV